MTAVDALPDRPVVQGTLDRLEASAEIDVVQPLSGVGAGDRHYTTQFTIVVGADLYALHFDPDAGSWRVVFRGEATDGGADRALDALEAAAAEHEGYDDAVASAVPGESA